MRLLRETIRIAAALIASGLIAACQSGGAEAEVRQPDGLILLQPEPDRKGQVERLLPGINAGLELHRIAVVVPFDNLRRTLARHAAADPLIDEEKKRQLKAHGIRVISVPRSDLSGIVARLNHEPIVDSAWMGQVSEWTSVAEGPGVNGSTLFDLAGETVVFSEGQFRLLIRAYVVPMEDDAYLRLEIVPQFHRPQRDPFVPNRSFTNLMGEYIADAAAGFELDGSRAVIMTADDPGILWPFENRSEESGNDDERAGESGDEAEYGSTETPGAGPAGAPLSAPLDETGQSPYAAVEPKGPTGGGVRTVGEEIFDDADGVRRLVLIFVPRLPNR